jgi:hypothetical protein
MLITFKLFTLYFSDSGWQSRHAHRIARCLQVPLEDGSTRHRCAVLLSIEGDSGDQHALHTAVHGPEGSCAVLLPPSCCTDVWKAAT